ncbi:MAG TPA: alpha/beta hydrolase, partial [Chthoniobacteraceae bacterium]|nr:alpha/beta hydrolase [Chthoniobacteraceae bacterium]
MKTLLVVPFLFLSDTVIAQQDRPPRERPALSIPAGFKAVRDVEYVTGGGASRSLDLYLPEAKPDKPLPLVVWIHGGAWLGGNKDRPNGIALLRAGFAVASINYRLSQEAIFPAQIEDCKAAIRFLRAKAADFGIDGGRIGAFGSSAGGHLVALLGVSADRKEWEVGDHLDQSSQVQAVCDWFGPTNLLTMGAQSGPNSRLDHDAPDSPESKLIGAHVPKAPDKASAASPLSYVTSDDAPMLIVHGDADPVVPVKQSETFYAALEKAGVKATLHIVKGGGH